MVVLALVLILVVFAAPDDNGLPGDVLATVDGEAITRQQVASMQQITWKWDEVWVEADEVLEQLISQELLFSEAERRGHLVDIVEAELELLARLAANQIPLDELYQMLQSAGLTYDEFLEYRMVQLSITALLNDEIEEPEVTEEDIIEAYEEYRIIHLELSSGREPPPLEDIRGLIVLMAKEGKRQNAISAYVEELRDNTDIVYLNSA